MIRAKTVSAINVQWLNKRFCSEGTLGTEGHQQQANHNYSKDLLHSGHTLRFQLRAIDDRAAEMTKRVSVRRGLRVPQSSMSTRSCVWW